MSGNEKCVLTGRVGSCETWCGRTADVFDWCFVDAAHAALNAKQEGLIVACRDCALAIVGALKSQHGW